MLRWIHFDARFSNIEMKKFDIGQLIAVLANLGVVVGLAFLAIEISQNNDALEAQSRDSWINRQVHILEALALNPDLLGLLLKAEDDENALTKLELERVRSIGIRTFVVWQHQYSEMRRDRLSEAEVIGLQRAVFCFGPHKFGTGQAWRPFKLVALPEYVIWFEEQVFRCE